MIGTASPNDIEEFVEKYNYTYSKCAHVFTLRDFLGMTEQEFKNYLEIPESIGIIVERRRKNKNFF
jgi:hypothetical protein